MKKYLYVCQTSPDANTHLVWGPYDYFGFPSFEDFAQNTILSCMAAQPRLADDPNVAYYRASMAKAGNGALCLCGEILVYDLRLNDYADPTFKILRPAVLASEQDLCLERIRIPEGRPLMSAMSTDYTSRQGLFVPEEHIEEYKKLKEARRLASDAYEAFVKKTCRPDDAYEQSDQKES
jgi:hypothetical protein